LSGFCTEPFNYIRQRDSKKTLPPSETTDKNAEQPNWQNTRSKLLEHAFVSLRLHVKYVIFNCNVRLIVNIIIRPAVGIGGLLVLLWHKIQNTFIEYDENIKDSRCSRYWNCKLSAESYSSKIGYNTIQYDVQDFNVDSVPTWSMSREQRWQEEKPRDALYHLNIESTQRAKPPPGPILIFLKSYI